MTGNICRAGCENLTEGIIVQAAEDFRRYYWKVLENPRDEEARRYLASVTDFFLSDWYQMMTRVDGAYLMAALKKEVAEKHRKKTAKSKKHNLKREKAQIRSNL